MNSTAAIFSRIVGSSATTNSLDVFAGAPAVFGDAAPDDYLTNTTWTRPCIVIAPPTRDEPLETFTETGRLIVQDIRVFTKFTGSSAALDTLARRVRDLFHNRPGDLVIQGGSAKIATATGPNAAPTSDPSLIGRRITLRLELQEN